MRAVVASFSCLGVFATDQAAGLAGLARASDLSAAIGNNVALAFARYQTGNMDFSLGNYDSALAAYEQCIELSSRGQVRMFELWAHTMLAARATDATLIGFLEVQDPIGLFLVARQRERAATTVNAHPDAGPWKARGALIDRNAIVDYALTELITPG